MREIIQEFLTSNGMNNAYASVVVLILNWIKNKYDLNQKNKGMGYWKMKYRKGYSFVDMIMDLYKKLAVLLIVVVIIRIYLNSFLETKIAYTISGVSYMLLLTLFVCRMLKKPKVKVELWNNGVVKKKLIFLLLILYIIVFFEEILQDWMEFLWMVILVAWVIALFKNSEMIFILDSSYADIYINGNVIAEFVMAGSMRKQGDWVFVDREVGGCYCLL